MEFVHTASAPAAIGPYSQAVKVGNLLFTSGQIPLKADGTFVEGDIREQIRQVLQNLDEVLKAAGFRREEVVKSTIFLTDLGDFQVVNEEYGAFFGSHRPARSCVQVAQLPRNAKVEIELTAVKQD
jgi:2-iminobutanoate/2-iminopropanoate deaminase